MLDLKRLELDLKPRRTAWLGDPDVDQDETDVRAWHDEGAAPRPRPQGKPAFWRWRPLDECERDDVLLADNPTEKMRLTVAYGLLSIDGVPLGRDYGKAPAKLDQASVSLVQRIGERYRVEIPSMDPETGAPRTRPKRNADGTPALDPETGEPVLEPEMTIVTTLGWIAGVIYRATFQREE